MRAFTRNYLLSLLLFNLAACSSMQPVSVENAMQRATASGIDYGSLVEVKTLDHRSHKFRVTEMNAEGLGGKPGFFRFEDMESLRVQSEKPAGNGDFWGYLLGALGIAALIALLANADSVTVCSPSPCPQ
jgi:hypothetical protein